jgi:hypothetical protein
VVFPYPAGATTDTIGPESSRLSRSISEGRPTAPGRAGGGRSFDAAISKAGR